MPYRSSFLLTPSCARHTQPGTAAYCCGRLPRLTDTGRITLRYLDRFDVVLKSDDDLDYRLNYLAAVIQRLDGSDQGTIQWDKDGKARFIPG